MDASKSRIPDSVRSIHLIAVCGTGMGALAGALKDLGYEVTGSDQGVYPPMSDFLAQKGIRVADGFDPAHLAPRPDLAVIGNAVSRTNPEASAVLDMGLPYCSMPQALNRFLVRDRQALLVTGTHGKTTTASLLAHVLAEAGTDPSFFIGGIVRDFGSNYRIGEGPYVVVEGDEYDTAFFDKGPKFMHFTPRATVLTGVEFDHADIYPDLSSVLAAFARRVGTLPARGLLSVCDEGPHAPVLAKDAPCRVVPYGRPPGDGFRLDDVRIDPPWTCFSVSKAGTRFGTFRTRMIGEHNLMNALAVISVADDLGVPVDVVGRALETFQGPKRRQEVRGVRRGVTVMDDFAHHPTAVRETLRAVRSHTPDGRIIAVFEPRTNTSMRRVFQDVYPGSFGDADMVCVRRPSRLDKVPESERFSSERLVSDLRKAGKEAHHFPETDSLIAFLLSVAREKDLILVMSNGGFDRIHERLLEQL